MVSPIFRPIFKGQQPRALAASVSEWLQHEDPAVRGHGMGGFNGVSLNGGPQKHRFQLSFQWGNNMILRDNLGDPFILGVDDSDWSTALSL